MARRTNLSTENWPSVYIAGLRALSKKHRTDDSVPQALQFLRNLERDTRRHGRGKIWIPEPAKRGGYFPVIENVPYESVKRAIRKNTSSRERVRTWKLIEGRSSRPFIPLSIGNSLTERQQRSFMQSAAIALPVAKGRQPRYLGERVPGDVQLGPGTGSRSIASLKQLSPEEWKRGFTMRKFQLNNSQRKDYGLRDAIKRGRVWLNKPSLDPRKLSPDFGGKKTNVEVDAILKNRVKRRSLVAVEKIKRKLRFANNRQRKDYILPILARALPLAAKAGRVGLKVLGSKPVQAVGTAAMVGGAVKDRRPTQPKPGSQYSQLLDNEIQQWYLFGFNFKQLKEEGIPAALRGATLGALGAIHQEVGLPPTTVDGIPLQRTGIDRNLQQFTNDQLRTLSIGLTRRIRAGIDANGTNSSLAKIRDKLQTELELRKDLIM